MIKIQVSLNATTKISPGNIKFQLDGQIFDIHLYQDVKMLDHSNNIKMFFFNS